MATPKQERQRHLRMLKGQISLIEGLTNTMLYNKHLPIEFKRYIEIIKGVSTAMVLDFNKVVGWKEK